MRKFLLALVGFTVVFAIPGGCPVASERSQSAPHSAAVERTATQQESAQKVTEYTLPPELYRKAHTLGQIYFWGQLVTPVYSWLVLLLLLDWKLAPRYRDWAGARGRGERTGFVQALIFAPPLILSLAFLGLPLDAGEHWVSRRFGISVQGWGSWLWDWIKGEIVLLIVGTILIWILYAVMRKAGRRWWFYFWLVSLPIMVLLVFLQPLIVDPLFHKFEPLESKDPVLVAALERMVQRAGEDIAPERMFWMGAAEKTTGLNAYVTGIGASKRIVVWDTTISKMTTPEIVSVAGHEMGHYVLNHVWKGIAFGAAGLFVLFYLGFRTIGWLLARNGTKWGIRGLDDWASLPALLLLFSIFSFIGTPIESAFSRYVEHQADQYGLEVTHGLTPDSNQVAAQSLQVLGELDLADPAPNPIDVFLFYSHPPIADRIRFALNYDPWIRGGHSEFVK